LLRIGPGDHFGEIGMLTRDGRDAPIPVLTQPLQVVLDAHA
jgi:CRP-like cAMP-binding protein